MQKLAKLLPLLPALCWVQPMLAGPSANTAEFFETKIRPVFANKCYACHTDSKLGGLRMDSRESLLKGGKSGPALVAGKPEESLLVKAIEQTGSLKMPAGGKLEKTEIDAIIAWVKDGAFWPEEKAVAAPASNEAAFFDSKVHPILAEKCYSCHTDAKSGGLRLDNRADILKGGKSGPALVPGKPEESLLIAAVKQTGKLKMPMGGKLSAAEVAVLEQWVKDGAAWSADANISKKGYTISPERRAFWSWQPLKVVPPKVTDTKWAKTDIDRYVMAKQQAMGVKPVGFADRRTLIRRAYLDLTGLLPTYEQITAFENDKSPNAFEKVVDELLASPHYGERWGRLWLDVARYGEDDYRSLDPLRRGYAPYEFAYLYRDWVVKAFNQDLPYDQFVRAQLAADQMDEKVRVKMLPALGFLGQGPYYYDNGAVEITHADERHDRVDVVSRGFLGLTVGCARCHDHKYDPIPQKDYYSMGGVFLNTIYTEYPQVPKAIAAKYDEQEKLLDNKQDLMREFMTDESKKLAESLALQVSKYMVATWKVTGEPKTDADKVVEQDKLDFELLQRYIRFTGKAPDHYPFLKDWQAMIKRGGTEAEAKRLADQFQSLVTDIMFEKKEVDDENDVIRAKALPGTKKKKKGMKPSDFVTNDDFCPGCNLELKSLEISRTNLWTDVFQRDLDGSDPMQARSLKPGLLVFRGWGLERQLSADRRAYLDALRADIEKIRKQMPAHYPYVHGVRDAEKPEDLQVNLRGNPYNLGDPVPRGFLTVLSAPDKRVTFSKGSGRAELADAILAQPIAMRVMVNRIWKGHMGTGIVDTPSNFGQTGERPVMPELLDYLADSFQKNGLSIKKLHKMIMLSSVYQLSNEHSKEDYEKDAANRAYWRFNRRRMDAEQIRDSLLEVSGVLDNNLGGPSVELTPTTKRRTLYGKVSRYKLDQYLQLFDFPSPAITAETRYSTNVPLQRLFFMNSDFVQQQAESLARKIQVEPNNTARIQKAYIAVLGRSPSAEELNLGLEYLRNEPMREYEEQKKLQSEKGRKRGGKAKADTEPSMMTDASKPAPAEAAKDDMTPADEKVAKEPIVPGKGEMPVPPKGAPPAAAADAPPEMGNLEPNGMLAGMGGGGSGRGRGGDREGKEDLLPVTPLGRYVKVLLSSTEFSFIN